MDYNDQNEKAIPLSCIAIALVVIGAISLLSESYLWAIGLFTVGPVLALITWGIFPQSTFAKKVALICIGIIVLLVIITMAGFISCLHDLSNCGGLS